MKYRFGYLLVAAAWFSACNKEVVPSGQPTPQEITFNAYLQEGDHVRPFTRTVGGDLANGYYLYGVWTPGPYLDPTAQAAANYFVQNRKMNADGTTADASKLFWNTDGATYHSFFAYSIEPQGIDVGVLMVNDKMLPYGINLAFMQADDPAKQIDLLVADKSNIQTTEGVPSAVNLYFRHRLSKVSVRVFGSGGVNLTDCQAKITYTTNTNIGVKLWVGNGGQSQSDVNRGLSIVMVDGKYPDPKWFASMTHSGTYNLGGTFSLPGSAVAERYAVPVGDMIFIPNQTPKEGWATLELSYKPDGGSTVVTVTAPMPELTLKPMMQYVVNFNILETSQSLSVSSIQLTDWMTASGTIDQL